jgi:hypothetical protein
MFCCNSETISVLNSNDIEALYAISLKRYRFLTASQLSLLGIYSTSESERRMDELARCGLAKHLILSNADSTTSKSVFTLTRAGAMRLAKLKGFEANGLASTRNLSYFFLEHSLLITDFMCALESALVKRGLRLSLWKNERQLKLSNGRSLRLTNPSRAGERIAVIPDGLFSFITGNVQKHFFLEADRGTMSAISMRRKLIGYIQLFRKKLQRNYFNVPEFRVLIVTTSAFRRDKLRAILLDIGFCPNMFWFSTWADMSPDKILGDIWLKCRSHSPLSILD